MAIEHRIIRYQHEETGRTLDLSEHEPHPGPRWHEIPTMEADPRYRAVSSPSGRWQVFDRDRVMADCPGGPEDAERIAEAMNEMDREDPSDE